MTEDRDDAHALGEQLTSSPRDQLRVEKEIENGDSSRLADMRKAFSDHRTLVLQRMADDSHLSAGEIEAIKGVVQELRERERDFNDRVRAIQDRRHAEQILQLADQSNDIAERLANAAKDSNVIAGSAVASANALKWWTKVLAFATIGLVLATAVLIFVTAAA